MGLDNGIRLVTHRPLDKEVIPREFWDRLSIAEDEDTPEIHKSYQMEYKNDYDYELCYWRKWWPLRNAIMAMLSADEDEYIIKLSRKDLQTIECELMQRLIHVDEWEEEGSIFSWEEMAECIAYDIAILEWFATTKEPSLAQAEFYFYDSY